MTDNYRKLLIAILMVGTWLCGAVFGFGIGAEWIDETVGHPWGLLSVLGLAATFLFTLFIVASRLYPELCRTIDKEKS